MQTSLPRSRSSVYVPQGVGASDISTYVAMHQRPACFFAFANFSLYGESVPSHQIYPEVRLPLLTDRLVLTLLCSSVNFHESISVTEWVVLRLFFLAMHHFRISHLRAMWDLPVGDESV